VSMTASSCWIAASIWPAGMGTPGIWFGSGSGPGGAAETDSPGDIVDGRSAFGGWLIPSVWPRSHPAYVLALPAHRSGTSGPVHGTRCSSHRRQCEGVPVRFGLDIAQQRVGFAEVVRRAQLAEELRFDGAWGFDHFVPMYGEGPGECFEGMTTLAALAGMTSTIRLGLLVTGATYRHPSVFAEQALTVDHASHGRFELALGAAWAQDEHDRFGIPFPSTGERFDLLEDTLEIVTRLFTGDVVSYSGKRISLDRAQMRPLPVQRPHPPIWIGGSGPKRTLPLVARYADVWHAGGPDYVERSRQLDRLAEEAGRDPGSIGRAGSLSISESMSEIRRDLEDKISLGLDYVVCGWPGQGADQAREFAETVMPDYN
jgi:alkanesulfonate monooxygenase SsuD/methylene tetrahydromethanopterin reductase-like flavin-dependent oxidoreductase (luciferase family)